MDEEKKDELFIKYFEKLPCTQVRFMAYLFDKVLFRELPTEDYIRLMKLIERPEPYKMADDLIREFYDEI